MLELHSWRHHLMLVLLTGLVQQHPLAEVQSVLLMASLLILSSQESQTPLQGLLPVTLDPRTGPQEAASARSGAKAPEAVVLISIVETLSEVKLVVPGTPGVKHVGRVLGVIHRPVQHHHHFLQLPQP